jgi:hypothetical protein
MPALIRSSLRLLACALFVSACPCALLVSACDGQSGSHAVEAQAVKPAPEPTPSAPTTPAQSVAAAYLTAQSKLAADDLLGARAAFTALRSGAQLPALALTDALRKRIVSAASEAAAAPDLPAARNAFATLSDAMLAWFGTQANPLKETLVVAFCPMARAGKGAKWLQLGEKLRNPYFGAEMLECGSIDTQLKPAAQP